MVVEATEQEQAEPRVILVDLCLEEGASVAINWRTNDVCLFDFGHEGPHSWEVRVYSGDYPTYRIQAPVINDGLSLVEPGECIACGFQTFVAEFRRGYTPQHVHEVSSTSYWALNRPSGP